MTLCFVGAYLRHQYARVFASLRHYIHEEGRFYSFGRIFLIFKSPKAVFCVFFLTCDLWLVNDDFFSRERSIAWRGMQAITYHHQNKQKQGRQRHKRCIANCTYTKELIHYQRYVLSMMHDFIWHWLERFVVWIVLAPRAFHFHPSFLSLSLIIIPYLALRYLFVNTEIEIIEHHHPQTTRWSSASSSLFPCWRGGSSSSRQ